MDSISHNLSPLALAVKISLIALPLMSVLIIYNKKRYRKSVPLLFENPQFKKISIAELQKSLDIINRKYPTYQFIALEAGNIEFRGKKLLLIDGSIGIESCDGFDNENLFFVLDHTSSNDWFQSQKKVFKSIVEFDNFSFYRANIKKLHTELNKTQNQTRLHNHQPTF